MAVASLSDHVVVSLPKSFYVKDWRREKKFSKAIRLVIAQSNLMQPAKTLLRSYPKRIAEVVKSFFSK